jgi:hypothetical protein
MAKSLVLMAALLVLAACGPSNQQTSQVVPWLPLAPNVTPPSPEVVSPSVPPGTPACQAADLMAAVIGENGAGGHFFTYFAFGGVGPGSCFLDGTPSVGLVDSTGLNIPFSQRPSFMPPVQSGPAVVDPGPAPAPKTAVKFGEAGLTFDWVTQPEACPGTQPVIPSEAVIGIPAGGILTIAIPQGPSAYMCQGLGVSTFEGPNVPVQASPPPALPAIQLEIPHSARIGQELDYRLTLVESRGQPLDLIALCPTYEEELFADIVHGSPPLGGKHIYSLNCKPVGTLKPGASVTFQIVYKVPADAAPGEYTFMFGLGYWNAISSVLQVPITISK